MDSLINAFTKTSIENGVSFAGKGLKLNDASSGKLFKLNAALVVQSKLKYFSRRDCQSHNGMYKP